MPSKPATNKQAIVTPADKQAAARLKAIWDERRRDLGLTQETAGAKMGMNQSAVSQYLNGRIPIGLEALIKWSDLLGCDPKEIRSDIAWVDVVVRPREARPGDRGASAASDPAASHSVRLNVETLASAIATIESAFDKAGATMSAIGRAKIIAAYYADLVRTPDMDPKAAADAALAAVIRAMSKGAKDDQHVPAR